MLPISSDTLSQSFFKSAQMSVPVVQFVSLGYDEVAMETSTILRVSSIVARHFALSALLAILYVRLGLRVAQSSNLSVVSP